MNFVNFPVLLATNYFYFIKKIIKNFKKLQENYIFFFLVFYSYNNYINNYLKSKFSYFFIKWKKNKIQKKKNNYILEKNKLIKYYNNNKRVHLLYKKRKKIQLIMYLKRKNLFLTILDIEGNIISKTNIGSCGFKKRLKFTGFALQNTMRIFAEKIVKILQENWLNNFNIIWKKYMFLKAKNTQKWKKKEKKKKKLYLKKNLWYLKILKKKYKKKEKNLEIKILKFLKNIKKKRHEYIIQKVFKKTKNSKKKIKNVKNFLKNNKYFIKSYQFNKKKYMYIMKYSEKNKFYLNLLYYRQYKLHRCNYLDFFKKKILKHYLFLDLILKNSTKFWAFRYIFRGFRKLRMKIMHVQNKKPAIHSKGFRLKKKRRL